MARPHRAHVEELLADAGAEHELLLRQLPPEIAESLPVDAQGLTEAIDHLAAAAGLSDAQRRGLVRPHAHNPAVMHARVFGAAPLSRDTVIGSFVEGARVRADALGALADAIGGAELGAAARAILVEHPPPVLPAQGDEVDAALRDTYAAQERVAVLIATWLDEHAGPSGGRDPR
jgi:hypothetical protein